MWAWVARAAAVEGGEGDAADQADEDEDDRRAPADPPRLRTPLARGAGRGRGRRRRGRRGRGAESRRRRGRASASFAHAALTIASNSAPSSSRIGRSGLRSIHGSSCPWPSSIPRKVRIARVTRVRVPDRGQPEPRRDLRVRQALDDPQPHRFALVFGQSVEAADDRLADALRGRQVLDPLDLLVCERPALASQPARPAARRLVAALVFAQHALGDRPEPAGEGVVAFSHGTGRGARGRW